MTEYHQKTVQEMAYRQAANIHYRTKLPPPLSAALDHLDMIEAASVADAPYVDEEGDASWGSFVVLPRISIDECELWLDEYEFDLRRPSFEPLVDNPTFGRLAVFSNYTFLHQHTRRVVTAMVINEVRRTIDWASIWLRRAFPTFIFEAFCKNESLGRLRATLAHWMDGTSVQVALGIKIFLRSRRYVLVLHVRGQPVEEVEFGFDTPVRAGLAVSFPLGLMYKGSMRPPSSCLATKTTQDPIRLDLQLLRQLIAQPQ